MNLSSIEIDEQTFLEGQFMLPPLPEVVGQLLESIHSGKANADQVAALLASDPGLVAQILKLINSAYYGLPGPISDVKRAVAYLGLSEIERVALAATVMRFVPPAVSQSFRSFWSHSFYTALTTRLVAKRHAQDVDGDELQAAALLHDIGKLVYLKFFPDHLRELDRYRRSHGVFFHDAEAHYGLPSHRHFGALLCERWKLPRLFREACAAHELSDLPDLVGHREDLTLIAVGNLLACHAGEPLSDETKAAVHEATTRVLDLSDTSFTLLMGEIYDLRGDVDAFLQQL